MKVKKLIHFSNPNGSGALAGNEGNLGADDIFGFDESNIDLDSNSSDNSSNK